MKILLIAINAKYIHSNLAIQYLKAYAKDYTEQITLKEFTINQYTEDILQGIYREKPDFIAFSCYIWNITIVEELCIEIRKLLPQVKLWLGGPEVSYDAKLRLKNTDIIDGIMIGEGEETFLELMDYYILGNKKISDIKGIAFRQDEETVITAPLRSEMDLSQVPFPYEDMEAFKNKIIYYETSRGCPYSCSYCLSSVDKKVRLRDIDLVKKELAIFLDNKIPQVKFVDRTFNCNKKHALAIWEYIKEHDNGITNFHFEISADILDEEEIKLLNSMRIGLVQLEIGVQSTNPETIRAIHRKMDFEKLKIIVDQIHKGENIHAHLDLIVGLPYEDFASFKKSFCDVYSLSPDQLQLGFLKVLKGSAMYTDCKDFGIVYKSAAPYEVLYTKWLTYDEILVLKSVEEMIETYYNSGQFVYTIKYMEHFFKDPFELYLSLADFYDRHKLLGIKHNRIARYEILIDFMKERADNPYGFNPESSFELKAFQNILVHDLYLRENMKSRPAFAEDYEPYKELYRDFYRDEEKMMVYISKNAFSITTGQLKPNLHIEHYDINVQETAITGKTIQEDQFILYDYMHRNPLNSQSKVTQISIHL